MIPIVTCTLRIASKGLKKEAERIENWQATRHHPNCSILVIIQNTKKTP